MPGLRMIRNRSLFVKSLLSMTAIVIVSVMLISYVTYAISADTSIRNSIESNQSILDQQRELIHKELYAVKNVASSLMMTQSYLYKTVNGKLSVGSLIDLSRLLDEQLKLSPYIDSVYLVYAKLDLVLTSRSDRKMAPLSSFEDRSWLPEMNKASGSRTVWLTGREDGLSGGTVTSLMQKTPLIGPVDGAIVVNLKLDALFTDFLSHYHNKKGTTIVLGPGGEVLYSDAQIKEDAQAMLADLSPSALAASGSGSYANDRDWIVTYTTSDLTGWKFVNLTRKSVLLEGLERIKKLVFAVAALYAAIAIGLSFYISRRLYRPLRSVVAYIRGADASAGTAIAPGADSGDSPPSPQPPPDEASFIRQSFERLSHSREEIRGEKERIESLLGANRSAIKEKVLGDLIRGRIESARGEGREEDAAAEWLGLKLDFARFAILTLELEDVARLGDSADGKANKLRFHLFQYGLIEELGEEIDGELFVRDDERIVIALAVPEGRDDRPAELAARLQRHLESRHGLAATIGISRIHAGAAAVQTAYGESIEALSLKMYVGKGEIVPYSIVSSWKQAEETYYYPYELETKLQQALLQLNEEECAETVSRITREVLERKLGNANVQQLFFQLSGEIAKALVQTGGDLSVALGDRPFAPSGVQTLRDMEARLQEMCARIIAYNREKRVRLNDATLRHATEFMEKNYNNNITIETVAEHVQRSASFLSRIFKEATGSTINDYLIQLRLNRACELLRQPNYTLEDICREIGYSNVSYFSKLFKTRTGRTPGQYRQQHAAEGAGGDVGDGEERAP